jgi:hypothetical protein
VGLGQNSLGPIELTSSCLASTISCNNPHALWRKIRSKTPSHALGLLTLGQVTPISQRPSVLLLSNMMTPDSVVFLLPPRKLLSYMTTLLAPLLSNHTPMTCRQLLRIHWTQRTYPQMTKPNFPRNPRLLLGTLRSGRA